MLKLMFVSGNHMCNIEVGIEERGFPARLVSKLKVGAVWLHPFDCRQSSFWGTILGWTPTKTAGGFCFPPFLKTEKHIKQVFFLTIFLFIYIPLLFSLKKICYHQYQSWLLIRPSTDKNPIYHHPQIPNSFFHHWSRSVNPKDDW